jgi:hypothetical protein
MMEDDGQQKNTNRRRRTTAAESEAIHVACDVESGFIPPAEFLVEPSLPYRDDFPDHLLHQLHIGQRKLLMIEVEFLTRNVFGAKIPDDRQTIIIYAGAAPGDHIPFLAELFPQCQFILFDPAPYKFRPDTEQLVLHRTYFTTWVAQEFAKRHAKDDVLFISDIRSGNDDMRFREFEQCVRKDLASQREWVEVIRPRAALLKFRLPFDQGDKPFEYLDGTVLYQPWAPKLSAETRLEVRRDTTPTNDPFPTRQYFLPQYENAMFYHNIVRRNWRNYVDVTRPLTNESALRPDGLDGCYDCAREVMIWAAYSKQCLTLDTLVAFATLEPNQEKSPNQESDIADMETVIDNTQRLLSGLAQAADLDELVAYPGWNPNKLRQLVDRATKAIGRPLRQQKHGELDIPPCYARKKELNRI